MSDERAAAKNLLRALNDYDPGWPHHDSDLGRAMRLMRAALAAPTKDELGREEN